MVLHDGDHAWHVGILISHGHHPIASHHHSIWHLRPPTHQVEGLVAC